MMKYPMHETVITTAEETKGSSNYLNKILFDESSAAKNSTHKHSMINKQYHFQYKSSTHSKFYGYLTSLHDSKDHSIQCCVYNIGDFMSISNNSDLKDYISFLTKNEIIWDTDTGFVLFTSIWRLYQDVMKYIYKETKSQCDTDLPLLNRINQMFKHPFNSQNTTVSNTKDDSCSIKKFKKLSHITLFNCNYIDINWNNAIPHDLQKRLLDIHNEEHRVEIDDFDILISKIRGGLIKIQGSWIPHKVCLEICSLFCYPIRYFLVPVFGKNFPKLCESNNIHNLDCLINDKIIDYRKIDKKKAKCTNLNRLSSVSMDFTEKATILHKTSKQQKIATSRWLENYNDDFIKPKFMIKKSKSYNYPSRVFTNVTTASTVKAPEIKYTLPSLIKVIKSACADIPIHPHIMSPFTIHSVPVSPLISLTTPINHYLTTQTPIPYATAIPAQFPVPKLVNYTYSKTLTVGTDSNIYNDISNNNNDHYYDDNNDNEFTDLESTESTPQIRSSHTQTANFDQVSRYAPKHYSIGNHPEISINSIRSTQKSNNLTFVMSTTNDY